MTSLIFGFTWPRITVKLLHHMMLTHKFVCRFDILFKLTWQRFWFHQMVNSINFSWLGWSHQTFLVSTDEKNEFLLHSREDCPSDKFWLFVRIVLPGKCVDTSKGYVCHFRTYELWYSLFYFGREKTKLQCTKPYFWIHLTRRIVWMPPTYYVCA